MALDYKTTPDYCHTPHKPPTRVPILFRVAPAYPGPRRLSTRDALQVHINTKRRRVYRRLHHKAHH